MKKTVLFFIVFFLFSCKKQNKVFFINPQKGDIFINEIVSLHGNVSFNADPNANPNFVNMKPLSDDNDKIAERELFKQNYFKVGILDVRQLTDNIKPNQFYFLDDKKTIKFMKMIDENHEMKFKVQRGNEISIFDFGYYERIDGINLIDLNKDGVKDILVLQEGYVSNNFLYNFHVYSAIQ